MRSPYALRLCAAVLLATVLFAPRAEAQDDLSLFGFFQTQLRYNQSKSNLSSAGPEEVLSFSVQQLNVFASSRLSDDFSAFVNAEITNTFSSESGFGTLRLEEAWGRYNHSAAFNLKAGLLIPTFNNLNEVKNRTPLLPYVFRPLAYETSFASIIPIREIVPDQAYVQAYGSTPVGPARIDYAAFVGNSESSYAIPEASGSTVAGSDTSMSKLFGGRLGLRYRSIKAGVSATRDMRNLSTLNLSGNTVPVGLGEAPRTRIGADLSFNQGLFFGEAEMIQVLTRVDDEQEATLTFLATSPVIPDGTPDGRPNALQGVISPDIDKEFYHAMLGVNITDAVYAYGMFDHYQDFTYTGSNGLDIYSVGLGYRPIDAVVVKGQYVRSTLRDVPTSEFLGNTLYLAVSISF